MIRRLLSTVVVVAALPAAAVAQSWNAPAARDLADRAIARRAGAAADTTLRDYRARAHGFLFFLGAFGEGLAEPPRLIKADQLELEVYWKAPGASKQRIIGWRDRVELPTDMIYHQDHLGIVQNAFGSSIRLGEGDEVRDVPHPLSPGAPLLYDYALGDTITVALPGRAVRVLALAFRPKDLHAPRVVGTAYVDAATADVVRLAFNFTPTAYRDRLLEDVSIVLDNALFEGRWWLPVHQEMEIRRRLGDLPMRGIIRGRWEIDGYAFNVGLSYPMFAGPEIVAAPQAQRDSFPWEMPIGEAIQGVAEPVRRNDLAAVRAEVARLVGRRTLSGAGGALRHGGLSVRGASDLLHANRVEGLTPGAGAVWRPAGDRSEIRGRASYGFADRHVKATIDAALAGAWGTVGLSLYREVRDVADEPVVAPLINSIASQEFGDDYGDYYLATGARVAFRHPLGTRVEWQASLARDGARSLPVRVAPATGTFRPNPALGGPSLTVARFALHRASEGFAVRRDLAFDASVEAGRLDDADTYLRLAAAGHWLVPVGGTRVLLRAQAGLASADLPARRGFVLGGRGTLLGDAFRSWGGRAALLGHIEWRVPVPFPSLSLGQYARTPGSLLLAPYVAAGITGSPIADTPWTRPNVIRITTALALEWLGVFRLEMGYGVQSRRLHYALGVTRDFWSVL